MTTVAFRVSWRHGSSNQGLVPVLNSIVRRMGWKRSVVETMLLQVGEAWGHPDRARERRGWNACGNTY